MQTALNSPFRSIHVSRTMGIVLLFCVFAIITAMTLDFGVASTSPINPVYDSQIKASLITITTNESNPLNKGSILDYSGYLISYSFATEGKTFAKTEVIKSSQLEKVESIKQLISSSAQSIWVQFDSQNPHGASIDFSRSMVSR